MNIFVEPVPHRYNHTGGVDPSGTYIGPYGRAVFCG
jgi:hypothetical protein